MEQKMASGELTQDGLKREAEGMMGQMGENPMFKNMMQGMQGVQQATESNVDTGDTPRPNNGEELSREEKQRRLREKIKQKRDNR